MKADDTRQPPDAEGPNAPSIQEELEPLEDSITLVQQQEISSQEEESCQIDEENTVENEEEEEGLESSKTLQNDHYSIAIDDMDNTVQLASYL